MQRTQRAKRAKEGGKSKSAGFCRNKKQGEGKGSPRLERFRVVAGKEEQRGAPGMSTPRGQHGPWYANKHHSHLFVLSFFGRSHIKTKTKHQACWHSLVLPVLRRKRQVGPWN